MRKLVFIALALICFGAHGQQVKSYHIKSGYIKLKLTGSIQGTRELWWDDYGSKTCEIEQSTTSMEIMGMKQVEKKHTLSVLVNDQYWERDYIKQTATTWQVFDFTRGQGHVDSMDEEQQEARAEEVLTSMGGEVLGTERIANYECNVYKLMGITTWAYKGIELKKEAKVMGLRMNELVEVFKPNSSVAADKFIAPKDMPYRDRDAMLETVLDEANDGDRSTMAIADADALNEDRDKASVLLTYSFDKFKKVTSELSYSDYSHFYTTDTEELYMATYMSGEKMIIVNAVSSHEVKEDDLDEFESLTVNGHPCYYGTMENGAHEDSVLIMEYLQHDMFILIFGKPNVEKLKLLEVAKQLNF